MLLNSSSLVNLRSMSPSQSHAGLRVFRKKARYLPSAGSSADTISSTGRKCPVGAISLRSKSRNCWWRISACFSELYGLIEDTLSCRHQDTPALPRSCRPMDYDINVSVQGRKKIHQPFDRKTGQLVIR